MEGSGAETPISQEAWEKLEFTPGQEVFVRDEKGNLERGWRYENEDEKYVYIYRSSEAIDRGTGEAIRGVERKKVPAKQFRQDSIPGTRHFEHIDEMAEAFNDILEKNDPRPLPGSGLLRWSDEGGMERIVLASAEDEPKKFDDPDDTQIDLRKKTESRAEKKLPSSEEQEKYLGNLRREFPRKSESDRTQEMEAIHPDDSSLIEELEDSYPALLNSKDLKGFYQICDRMWEKKESLDIEGKKFTGIDLKDMISYAERLIQSGKIVAAARALQRLPNSLILEHVETLLEPGEEHTRFLKEMREAWGWSGTKQDAKADAKEYPI